MPKTPSVEQTRAHDATVRGLVAAFTAIGAPNVGRYDAALGMASAIQVLRRHSRSPESIRLRARQFADLVKSFRAAQANARRLFPDSLSAYDMHVSLLACGALVLNWASPGRRRASTGEAMIEVDEVAAALHHILMAAAHLEAVNAKSVGRNAARKELFDSFQPTVRRWEMNN